MIVIFGASSDVGAKLAAILLWHGASVRPVLRSEADLSSGSGVSEALRGARIVVSCAHAQFTPRILGSLPQSVENVVLMGSAWRYSGVANQRAELVREAERVFVASGRRGVMLHPTMIYGGVQENNIQRLLSMIRMLPFIVAPGGGHQRVQPIYIDDVVSCLLSAVSKTWEAPKVVAIAGPPLAWREMALLCASSLGLSRKVIELPMPLAQRAAAALAMVMRFDAGIVDRFNEDVQISLIDMQAALSVSPRHFKDGINQAVASWRQESALT